VTPQPALRQRLSKDRDKAGHFKVTSAHRGIRIIVDANWVVNKDLVTVSSEQRVARTFLELATAT
jgi:hypothetical protein